MLKRSFRAGWAQAALARIAGRYLSFALATTRWTIHGLEHVAPFTTPGHPGVVAVWHERLALLPALLLQARRMSGQVPPVAVLASRHADGRLIGQLLHQFGVGTVHGSTARDGRQRGGAAGIRRLLDHIVQGGHVVITPDGPRGPRRHAAGGVAQLAALAGVPVLPCAAQTTRRRTLRSWDRMVLPLPWGRGVIVCRPVVTVARDGIEVGLAAITTALDEAADQADRLCLGAA